MLELVRWMTQYKLQKGVYNVGSLAGGIFPHGGKWFIPADQLDTFFELLDGFSRDSEGNPDLYHCLVYKPLPAHMLSPLHFDIDLKSRKETPVNIEACVSWPRQLSGLSTRNEGGPSSSTWCAKVLDTGKFERKKMIKCLQQGVTFIQTAYAVCVLLKIFVKPVLATCLKYWGGLIWSTAQMMCSTTKYLLFAVTG